MTQVASGPAARTPRASVVTVTPSPPRWFSAALAQPPDLGDVLVEGARIRYRAWGPRGTDGLVLVHGGAAHSRWWDHIAPLLADGRRVIAVDLSGHGDSDRRQNYSLALWGDELMDVARDGGITGPPVIIGHSMGGFVALSAASRHGTDLTGVVVIDSPVRDPTPEEEAAREKRAFGPLRVYPSREEVLKRFRPIPDEGPFLPYVLDHIAETSLREVPGGWSWKFDVRIFGRPAMSPSVLSRLDCRVALFRAERGMVSDRMEEVMYDRLGKAAPLIEIPDAGHHVMLDQPLALVTGLRTLLADWAHSTQQVPV
jgi:pimeloyl-ACP methyl ester carboxylesterase